MFSFFSGSLCRERLPTHHVKQETPLLPNIRPLLWAGVRGEFEASLAQTEKALGTSWAFQPAPAQVEALA